jgi:hypothetical protein
MVSISIQHILASLATAALTVVLAYCCCSVHNIHVVTHVQAISPNPALKYPAISYRTNDGGDNKYARQIHNVWAKMVTVVVDTDEVGVDGDAGVGDTVNVDVTSTIVMEETVHGYTIVYNIGDGNDEPRYVYATLDITNCQRRTSHKGRVPAQGWQISQTFASQK